MAPSQGRGRRALSAAIAQCRAAPQLAIRPEADTGACLDSWDTAGHKIAGAGTRRPRSLDSLAPLSLSPSTQPSAWQPQARHSSAATVSRFRANLGPAGRACACRTAQRSDICSDKDSRRRRSLTPVKHFEIPDPLAHSARTLRAQRDLFGAQIRSRAATSNRRAGPCRARALRAWGRAWSPWFATNAGKRAATRA